MFEVRSVWQLHWLWLAGFIGLLSGCQQTTSTAVVPNDTVAKPKIIRVERTINVVRPEEPTEALSVLRIVDGTGCPNRDPATYGVFLRSERDGTAIICYYN